MRVFKKVIDITDQEVMDRLGVNEPEELEEDQLFKTLSETPKNFYIFTGFNPLEFEKLWGMFKKLLITLTRGEKQKYLQGIF